MKKIGINGFVLALLCAILVAWIYPALGTMKSPFSLSTITDIGIAGIFFFYGLRISPEKMVEGITNWKLHVLIQSAIFLLFPALILVLASFFPNAEENYLWIGVFFVAALPSTVSSSVLMVSIARGSIPAAIFNASLSSILGVVLTPLWMRFFLSHTGKGIGNYSDILLKLLIQIILPLALGFFLHRILSGFAEKYKKYLRIFEQGTIVLIVYVSFSNSFSGNIFANYGMPAILYVALGMGALFTIVYWIIKPICKWLRFSLEDTITAIFCGSKKSLVHGSAMSKILFKNAAYQGVILVPIMIYHIIQLIVVSIIAVRLSERKAD